MSERFCRTVELPVSAAEAFAWHEQPGAIVRLSPPWEQVKLVSQTGGIRDGAEVVLRAKVGPFGMRWVAEHYGYRAGEQFCDRLVVGLFKRWEHTHRFEALSNGRCRMTDAIEFELPGGAMGRIGAGSVRRRLERMFAYRHAVTVADLGLPRAAAGRVLISGASGVLGEALDAFLRTQDWTVDRLVRRGVQAAGEIRWDPVGGAVDWPADYACDAVIHLAGANVADGRWTQARREEILRSRVDGTRTLVAALGRLTVRPKVFLSGSAVGIYGSRGAERIDETASVGAGFLAEVCEAWEEAAAGAEVLGMRRVMLRTGIVLTPAGGALAKLLPAFRVGLGGRLGAGNQAMSWISIDDWQRAVRFALVNESVRGAINVVGPTPVTNAALAATLGRVLRRSAVVPVPATVLRLMLGQMADEALLGGVAAMPERLTRAGFEFLHPSLEKALRHVLGKGGTS